MILAIQLIWLQILNTIQIGFYFGYSSMRTPDSLFSVKYLLEGKGFKEAEIKGSFSSSDYKVERKLIEARDGTKVPVSFVYKRSLFNKGKIHYLFTVMGLMGIL